LVWTTSEMEVVPWLDVLGQVHALGRATILLCERNYPDVVVRPEAPRHVFRFSAVHQRPTVCSQASAGLPMQCKPAPLRIDASASDSARCKSLAASLSRPAKRLRKCKRFASGRRPLRSPMIFESPVAVEVPVCCSRASNDSKAIVVVAVAWVGVEDVWKSCRGWGMDPT